MQQSLRPVVFQSMSKRGRGQDPLTANQRKQQAEVKRLLTEIRGKHAAFHKEFSRCKDDKKLQQVLDAIECLEQIPKESTKRKKTSLQNRADKLLAKAREPRQVVRGTRRTTRVTKKKGAPAKKSAANTRAGAKAAAAKSKQAGASKKDDTSKDDDDADDDEDEDANKQDADKSGNFDEAAFHKDMLDDMKQGFEETIKQVTSRVEELAAENQELKKGYQELRDENTNLQRANEAAIKKKKKKQHVRFDPRV